MELSLSQSAWPTFPRVFGPIAQTSPPIPSVFGGFFQFPCTRWTHTQRIIPARAGNTGRSVACRIIPACAGNTIGQAVLGWHYAGTT